MSLWKEKKWGAKRLIKEFPGLLQKIDKYGTIERKLGKHNHDLIVTSQSIAVNK